LKFEQTGVINKLWEKAKEFISVEDMQAAVEDLSRMLGVTPMSRVPGDYKDLLSLDSEGKNYIYCGLQDPSLTDFVIVKNLSDMDFNIVPFSFKEEDIGLYSGDLLVLGEEGSFYAGSDKDIAKRVMVFKIERYVGKISDDIQYNFEELFAICDSYDRKYEGELALSNIAGAAFVDVPGLKEKIRDYHGRCDFLTWLRDFVGDTADADYYCIDFDGKLKIAEAGDFKVIAGIIRDKVFDAIKPELPCETVRIADSGGCM
jgi:hypothetical protein